VEAAAVVAVITQTKRLGMVAALEVRLVIEI
jgi:hypothetical protein